MRGRPSIFHCKCFRYGYPRLGWNATGRLKIATQRCIERVFAEYVCDCGHKGWTRHGQVLTAARLLSSADDEQTRAARLWLRKRPWV